MFRETLAACIVAALSLVGLGCAVTPAESTSDPTADDPEAMVASSSLGFFSATRSAQGYRVHGINGAWMRCPKGPYATTCAVDAIDLSALVVSEADGTELLGEIGDDPAATSLLLVGRVTTQRRHSQLQVYEVWRSPKAAVVPDGGVLHVSHQSKQALLVNGWWQVRGTATDFSAAPSMTDCRAFGAGGDGPDCWESNRRAIDAASSTAGIVALGKSDRSGVLHVSQYFLKVSIGEARNGDGYSYCQKEQRACNLACIPLDKTCFEREGRGRGLLDTSFTRNQALSQWLLQTSQLSARDLR